MSGVAIQGAAWGALLSRRYRHGYDALTIDERRWLNVGILICDIGNGGLISHFYNSGADTLPDTLAALAHLGASDVAGCVDRVAALFPGGVPATVDERNRVIDSWDDDGTVDAALDRIEHEVERRIADLERRLDDFVAATGLGLIATTRDGSE